MCGDLEVDADCVGQAVSVDGPDVTASSTTSAGPSTFTNRTWVVSSMLRTGRRTAGRSSPPWPRRCTRCRTVWSRWPGRWRTSSRPVCRRSTSHRTSDADQGGREPSPRSAPNSARDPREGTHRRLGVERAGVQRAGPVHQRHNSVHRSPHMIHRHDRHSDSLSSTALRFARGGRSSSHHT